MRVTYPYLTVVGGEGGCRVAKVTGPDQQEILAGPFSSPTAAWNAIDRLENEPVTKRESTVEWLWQKRIVR